MTAFKPDYRLTVYAPATIDPTELTVLTPSINAYHSDTFQVATLQGLSGYKPYLAYPQGRKGTYEPTTAKTTIGQLVFKIQDQRDSSNPINARRWVTAFMGDVTGKMQFSGLRAVVEESLDGGSTWSPFYVGRISDATLDDVLSYGLTLRDTSDDLNWDAFNYRPVLGTQGVSMQSLLPIGLTDPYRPFPAAGTLNAFWEISGNTSAITITKTDQANPVNLFTSELKSMGFYNNFADGITWWGAGFGYVTGSNTPIRAFISSPVVGQFVITQINTYQKLQVDAVTIVTVIELPTADPNYTPLSSIANGATVQMSIQPMYAPINDTNPVFISGVGPAELFRDLCLGKYGRINPSTGQPINSIPIDNAAFNALIADPSFDIPRYKVASTMTILDFFEKYIAPFGIGYRIEPQLQSGSIVGAIVPFDTRLPKTLVGLPTLTDSDLADFLGTWELGTPLSELSITYYNEEYIPTVDQTIIPWRLTETTATEIILLEENQKSDGATTTIDALGIRTDGAGSLDPVSMVNTMASFYISRFGNGAATVKLNCRRTTTTNALKIGMWCLVQISHLPDALSHLRGGIRLFQVTERSENGATVSFQFMDGGISAATAPPIVGNIASSSVAPTRSFILPAGAVTSSVRLEIDIAGVNIGSAIPVDSSSLWSKWGIFTPNTTGSLNYTISNLGANTRWYPRVRAVATTGEQPSAWSFPPNSYHETPPVTPPVSASFTNLTATAVDISWNNNGDLSSSVQICVSSPTGSVSSSVALILPGSTTYHLTGLSTASAANPYQVYVTHQDPTGVNSIATSVVFRVSGSQPAPSPAGRIVEETLAQVALVTTQLHDPTGVFLGIYPAFPSFDLELQRTVTSASVPDPTQWTSIEIFSANTFAATGFMYWDQLPNNGAVYWYEMRCDKTGYQNGAWTAAVSASTRQIDTNANGTPDSLLSVGAYNTATNASSSAATAITTATITSSSVGITSSSLAGAITTTSASVGTTSSSLAGAITTTNTTVTTYSSSFSGVVFTDSTGKIIKTPNPTGSGLWLGNTNLGYYNGTAWKTFMSNTGQFFLTGSSNHFLNWDGTNLTIAGNLTLLDLTVPFGTSITPGQNLLTSAQDWIIGGPPITALDAVNFSAIGNQPSQSIVLSPGPDGNSDDKMWRMVGGGAGGGASGNGGFVTDDMLIDPTKTYRYATWFSRRAGTDGVMYHGVGFRTPTSSIADIPTGTPDTNAYFWNDALANYSTGNWYLVVGYVFPYNYGTTQKNYSGVYDTSTGIRVSTGVDFKWTNTAATSSYWRSFLFNSSDGNTVAYFNSPMVHVVDGTEPSIDSLVSVAISSYASASIALTSASNAQTSATNASASAATANTLGTSTSASLSLVSSSFVLTRVSASAAFVSSALSALNIFTDSTGKIVRTPNTTGAGLYLGSTFLGYYNGVNWATFMSNTGQFYLTGSSASNFLAWDGSTLSIAGNINLLNATVPFGTNVISGQNLLTSAQDWVLDAAPLSQSSVVNFEMIGTAISQSIVMSTSGPQNTQLKVWQIIGGAASSGSLGNGGWNTDSMPIDPTKTYRYVMWVNYVQGSDGNLYHGVVGNNVANISTGTPNSNPYFWSSGPGAPELNDGEWYLFVGYVYPWNYGTVNYQNSGVYRRLTGTKVTNGNEADFKWASSAINNAYWRSYLYYSADHTTTTYFANPMVHVVDGTEPSLDSLLAFGAVSLVNTSASIGITSASAAQTTALNASSSAAIGRTSASLANTVAVNASSSVALVSSSFVQTRASASAAFVSSTLSALNIFTDSTGKIVKTPSLGGAGLYLGATALGYYNGSSFSTFMSNTGNFFLTGSGNSFLGWDGTNLTIAGAITLLDLTVPFGTNVTPGQNLLTSAQDWVVDPAPLSAASVPNFNSITAPASNSIQINPGPNGTNVAMWKVTGGTIGEGGWNTDNIPIDITKTYRYAVWFYRAAGGASGDIYHGVGANTVDDIAAGTPNGNPYFWFDVVSNYAIGNWYLLVGYVYPSNFGTTPVSPAQSGVYRKTDGVKVSNGQVDYKWDASTTQTLWRTFLDSSADTTTVIYFCSPMVHIVDGTEPTIDSLIALGTTAYSTTVANSSSLAGSLTTTNTTVVSNSSSLASKLSATSSSLSSSLVSTNTTVTTNSSSIATVVTTNSSSIATRVTTTSSSLAATTFTTTTGLITKTPSPVGSGLYLGAANLGYWDGNSWNTYMDNSGKFFLNGTGGNSLFWDGTGSLAITGSIQATSGTITGQLSVNTVTTTGSIAIGQYDTQNAGLFSIFSNPQTPTGTAKILFGKTATDGNELSLLVPQTLFIGAGASNDFSSKGGSDTSPIAFIRFDATSTSAYQIRYISSNNNTPYALETFAGAPYVPSSSYAHSFDGDTVMYRTNQGTHTGPILTLYGDLVISGTIHSNNNSFNTTYSDRRMKSDVTMLTGSLNKICQLKGVDFVWNENSHTGNSGSHDIGLIAQDVKAVIPEAVSKEEKIDDYYRLNYMKIIPHLVESIKTLNDKIDNLKSRNTG